jgi:hypothetical protein
VKINSILRMILLVAIPFIVTVILVAQQPEDRGIAEIGVMADFTTPGQTNLISLRIIGSNDQLKLQNIATILGYKLGAQPVLLGFSQGDPNIITDTGLGLDFQLPVMSNDGYLPIGPFAEACAPYVSTMKIVYVIRGNYTYNGFENYQDADISYNVPAPETTKNAATPIAFYRANVIIKKNNIVAANIPRSPKEKQKKQNKKILTIVFLIILTAGVTTGIILARAAVKHRQNK